MSNVTGPAMPPPLDTSMYNKTPPLQQGNQLMDLINNASKYTGTRDAGQAYLNAGDPTDPAFSSKFSSGLDASGNPFAAAPGAALGIQAKNQQLLAYQNQIASQNAQAAQIDTTMKKYQYMAAKTLPLTTDENLTGEKLMSAAKDEVTTAGSPINGEYGMLIGLSKGIADLGPNPTPRQLQQFAATQYAGFDGVAQKAAALQSQPVTLLDGAGNKYIAEGNQMRAQAVGLGTNIPVGMDPQTANQTVRLTNQADGSVKEYRLGDVSSGNAKNPDGSPMMAPLPVSVTSPGINAVMPGMPPGQQQSHLSVAGAAPGAQLSTPSLFSNPGPGATGPGPATTPMVPSSVMGSPGQQPSPGPLSGAPIGGTPGIYSAGAQTGMVDYKNQLNQRVTGSQLATQQYSKMGDLLFSARTGGLQGVRQDLAQFVSGVPDSVAQAAGLKPSDIKSLASNIQGGGSDLSFADSQMLNKLATQNYVTNLSSILPPGTHANQFLEMESKSANPNLDLQKNAFAGMLQYGQKVANLPVAEQQLMDAYSRDPATSGSIDRFPSWFQGQLAKNGTFGFSAVPPNATSIPSSPGLEAAAKTILAPPTQGYKKLIPGTEAAAYAKLRANPSSRASFEATFGPGSSLSVIGAGGE